MKKGNIITHREPRTIGEISEACRRLDGQVAAIEQHRRTRGLHSRVSPWSGLAANSNTSTSDASRTVVVNVCCGDFCPTLATASTPPRRVKNT